MGQSGLTKNTLLWLDVSYPDLDNNLKYKVNKALKLGIILTGTKVPSKD